MPLKDRATERRQQIQCFGLVHSIESSFEAPLFISFSANEWNISSTPVPSLALVSYVDQPRSSESVFSISHASRRSDLFKTMTNGSGPNICSILPWSSM